MIMKTSLTLLFVTLLLGGAALAQPNSVVPKNIRAANTLDNLFDGNGLATSDNLWGIPLEPGAVVGNTYLNPEWRRTALSLYDTDKVLEGYLTRYEIDLDQFDIKTTLGIKVLSGKKIKSFVWMDSLTKTPHYFVNGRDLKTAADVPIIGFFEVLAEGDPTLLSKTGVIVKRPNYNEKLDMGNRDTRIEKRAKYYYLENDLLHELPSAKKKIIAVFGDHAEALQDFVKVNKLSWDEEGHLKHIFEHYNGLAITE